MPRNLNDSTAVTVLFMMVSGGEQGAFSFHLHSFERVQLQVVKTAPNSQLLNLLSVSRLVSILDEADQCGVVCNLQELTEGSLNVQSWCTGRKQWGENTALRSSSADCTGAG